LNDNPGDVAKNIVIATTRWKKVSADEGKEHEEELCGKYWNDLFEKGVKYHRFDGATNSAWNIVDLVPLDRPFIPGVIREELEDFRSRLAAQTGNTGVLSLLKSLLGSA
jgi:hypothetical protein